MQKILARIALGRAWIRGAFAALSILMAIFSGASGAYAAPAGQSGWWTPGGTQLSPKDACEYIANWHYGTKLKFMTSYVTMHTTGRWLLRYHCWYPPSCCGVGPQPYGTTYLVCLSGYKENMGVCTPDDARLSEPLPPPLSCSVQASSSGSHADAHAGDPVFISSGHAYEELTDYETSGADPLAIKRYYRSTQQAGAVAASRGGSVSTACCI